MTDRRRNIFVLLLVAGLLIASLAVIITSRRSSGSTSRAASSSSTRRSRRRSSQVTPGGARPRDRHHARARRPARRRRAGDPALGPRPDRRRAARRQERRARRSSRSARSPSSSSTTGRRTSSGRTASPHPSDPTVTGGPRPARRAALSLYDAVMRAAQAPGEDRRQQHDRRQPVLRSSTRSTEAGRSQARSDDRRPTSRRPVRRQARPNAEVVEGQAGHGRRPGRAGRQTTQGGKRTDQLLRPAATTRAASGTDIKNPEQNFDQGAGGSGAPIVTFEFTDKGRKTWQNVTREIAQRGQDASGLPGQSADDVASSTSRSCSTTSSSRRRTSTSSQNPDGIDGRNGSQISGGFTITVGAGPRQRS